MGRGRLASFRLPGLHLGRRFQSWSLSSGGLTMFNLSSTPDRSALDAAYQAIGDGLREFGNIESTIALLFVEFMRPGDPKLSLIAFDSVRHVEAKIRVLQSVGKEALRGHEPLAQTLNRLTHRIGRRAKVRNKLAHWIPCWWHPTMGVPWAVTAPQPSPQHEIRLAPPGMTGGNYSVSDPTETTLSIDEIRDFRSACYSLYEDLINFHVEISRLKDRLNDKEHV